MHVVGISLYYADGSVLRFPVAQLTARWPMAPAEGVQVLGVYFAETYRTWHGPSRRWLERPYVLRFCSTLVGVMDLRTGLFTKREGQADYYWFDSRVPESLGAGLALDVPSGLAAGSIKTGTLLLDETFRSIYETAMRDRLFESLESAPPLRPPSPLLVRP